MATGMWAQLVRRWWVATALLILFITAAALAWNASPASPHTYSATRTLRVAVLPGDGDGDGDGTGTYGWSAAQASQEAIARDLAAPSLLTSPTYTAAVVGQLVGQSSSSTAGRHPTAAQVAQAVSASHSAGAVTLTVSWDAADGASALADAAIRELATQATASALPDGASPRFSVEGVGAPARLDAGAQAARSTDILLRGGLAALAVLIVAGALAAAQMVGRQGESPTTTAESARS